VSFAKREPRLCCVCGGSATGGVLCYCTSPASRNRCLRAHNECNQNANEAATRADARQSEITTIIRGNSSGLGNGGMNATERAINNMAGMTGMATAFGMPKRGTSIPATPPYRASIIQITNKALWKKVHPAKTSTSNQRSPGREAAPAPISGSSHGWTGCCGSCSNLFRRCSSFAAPIRSSSSLRSSSSR
jgi:hypothetical protein